MQQLPVGLGRSSRCWLRGIAAGVVLAPPSLAQGVDGIEPVPRQFQFRVNATAAEASGFALDEAAVAVKHDGARSCIWTRRVGGSQPPACINLLTNCDGEDVTSY
jgi:hypothetical protein